ncbi:MAG TPA: ABC transporter permease subunit [Spirochaetia bacterium]|nr:ABC transporter permease subunit [Spirochaetia bacterium]
MSSIVPGKQGFWSRLAAQRQLAWMSVPLVLYVLLFTYVPLAGWTIAFQDFKPAKGFASAWVGIKHFVDLFTDNVFRNVLRNTLAMSFINLVFNFTCAIGLALLLNEVRNRGVKRFAQTVSYLPHFLSWVVVAGLVSSMLASDGVFNHILTTLGIAKTPVVWLGQPNAFWWIVGFSNVWKEVGWNTIIYLAAMAAIDPALYEAAEMDGCGRFSRIRHVTLPGIRPTIVVLLILNLGWIMESGFEIQYLLKNGMNQDFSWSIDIYVVEYGLRLGNYSLATAGGIFKSVVNLVLLFSANTIASRLGQERLV